MITLDILTRQSLFTLLYQTDLDLAEQTKSRRCPFAGGRCIMPIISESLEVALLTLKRHLKFVSVCVAVVTAVAAGY
jgi:hypothetical protein